MEVGNMKDFNIGLIVNKLWQGSILKIRFENYSFEVGYLNSNFLIKGNQLLMIVNLEILEGYLKLCKDFEFSHSKLQ